MGAGAGEAVDAAAAVVTAPLPLLRAGDIRFEPPLPAEKRAALEAVKVRGHVVKFNGQTGAGLVVKLERV